MKKKASFEGDFGNLDNSCHHKPDFLLFPKVAKGMLRLPAQISKMEIRK